MGWTVFQTNGGTGEKEVVGGNRESALGLGNWVKAREHNNSQREGTGVDARQASKRIHGCQSLLVLTLSHFSRVQLFATLGTVACQAPLSIEFLRQEYWSSLPFPSPGDLPSLLPLLNHRQILYH